MSSTPGNPTQDSAEDTSLVSDETTTPTSATAPPPYHDPLLSQRAAYEARGDVAARNNRW